MSELAIEVRRQGDVARVELAGDFDLAVLPRFEDELGRVEESSPPVILIDLTRLLFIDSSGLRALIMADERAREANRRLAIVPGPPPVRRVFEITQLDKRLDFVDDASNVTSD
jgi:anti-sigma B factor antagonist